MQGVVRFEPSSLCCPAEAVSAARSAAALGYQPSAGWLQRWEETLQPHLPNLNIIDYTTVILALARLQHSPSNDWGTALMSAAGARLSEFNSDALKSYFSALAFVDLPITDDWAAGFFAEIENRWVACRSSVCKQQLIAIVTPNITPLMLPLRHWSYLIGAMTFAYYPASSMHCVECRQVKCNPKPLPYTFIHAGCSSSLPLSWPRY